MKSSRWFLRLPAGCGAALLVIVLLFVLRYGCDMGGRWTP